MKSLFSPSYPTLDRQAVHPTSTAYHECYTAQYWSTGRTTTPSCCTGKERMLVGNSWEMVKDIFSRASQLLGPLWFTTHSLPYCEGQTPICLSPASCLVGSLKPLSFTLRMHSPIPLTFSILLPSRFCQFSAFSSNSTVSNTPQLLSSLFQIFLFTLESAIP